MPYKLRKAPKRDLYWVVNKETGKKHSNEPLPLDRAKAQMKALYASESGATLKGKGNETTELFDELLETLREDRLEGSGYGKRYIERKLRELRQAYPQLTDEQAQMFRRGALAYLDRNEPVAPLGMLSDSIRGRHHPRVRELMDAYTQNQIEELLGQRGREAERWANPVQRDYQGADQLVMNPNPLYRNPIAMAQVQAQQALVPPLNRRNRVRIPKGLEDTATGEEIKQDEPVLSFVPEKQRNPNNTGKYDSMATWINQKGRLEDYVRNTYRRSQVSTGEAEITGELSGEGLFEDAINLGKQAYQRVKDVAKGIRKGYSPSARKMLEKYGVWNVVGLAIRRDPIQSAIHTAFNVLTLGMWQKALKDAKYDKLFHLGLIVELQYQGQRKKLLVEKNEVINIGELKPTTSQSEIIVIPPPRPTPTLNHFLFKAEQQRGESYFLYDPFENNCQDYILLLLNANNALTPYARSFVKQDVSNLVDKLPGYIKPVAKAITDLGGIANVAIQGGTRREDFFKQHNLSPSLKPSLKELSKISGVPLKTLQEVYNRGIGAYKTQPKSVRLKGSYMKNVDAPMEKKLSKEQWAWARVYSFLTGNEKHDNDLRANKLKKNDKKKSSVRATRPNPLSGAGSPPVYTWAEWTDMVYKRPMGGEVLTQATIPALAEYINSLPTPHQIRDILMTLYNSRPKTGLGKNDDVEEYYAKRIQEYVDWWNNTLQVLDELESVVLATYKEADEVFNQVRGGNMSGLDRAFQVAEIVMNGFDTLRKLTTPQGLFETGVDTLVSMFNTITSPEFNKPLKPTSYSYREEMANTLGQSAGELGRLSGQVVGAIGEAFGAKSQAEKNDPYVAEVLKRKRDDSLNVIRMFRKAGDYDLYRIKLLNDTQKENIVQNRTEGELRHQYEKDIFWINRLTDDQYINRFKQQPPKDRVYISFEDWKKGVRDPPIVAPKIPRDSQGRPCGVYEICKPVSGSGKVLSKFESQLQEAGLTPEEYLSQVKANAKKNGYDPSKITFSDKPEKKLQITTDKGHIRRFGRVGLGDYFIWKALEKIGKAPKGKAEQKKRTFHLSHSKIRGNWKSDKYSPNNLALNINW